MKTPLKVKSVLFFLFAVQFLFSVQSYSQVKDSVRTNAVNKSEEKFNYTDVLYTGFTYDLDVEYSNRGAWAISIGYRRLIAINDKWGANIITSLNCFYNGSSDVSNPLLPDPERKIFGYARNYFSAGFYAAPSYTFSKKFIMYAGVGVTYLQGNEFSYITYSHYPYSTFYGEGINNSWGDMFTKLIGMEFSPSERFAVNFEYAGTKANKFASIKTGMRF